MVVSDGENCFVELHDHRLGCLLADKEIFPCGLKLSVIFYGYRIVPSYVCRTQGHYKLELVYHDRDRWLVKTVEDGTVSYGFAYELPGKGLSVGQKFYADRGDNTSLTLWAAIQ